MTYWTSAAAAAGAGGKRGGTPHRQGLTDAELLALIASIHAEIKGACGSPRMVRELPARAFSPSKARVGAADVRERHPWTPQARYKATTDSRHASPWRRACPRVEFAPSAPKQVWTSDITYLWTEEGWLYLAIVLDLFNREVVGGSMRARMRADLVTAALSTAWFRRPPAPGLIHHYDSDNEIAGRGVVG